MSESSPHRVAVSDAIAWSAEGGRVGIVTCLTCGSALFLSPMTDVYALHDAWHQALHNEQVTP